MLIKLLPSHPIYPKIEALQYELTHAVNKWPFSAYQFMSDDERNEAIEMLLDEIGTELQFANRNQN